MLRYVLSLLLINACYHSSGLPADRTTKFVATSLLELAKNCEDPFLSNQIKSKVKDCSLSVPPYNEKQFQCLLFYDINAQLCAAVATAKLALNADNTTKITEKQDLNTLCESAKEWAFSNLTEYPNYSIDVGKVIKLSTRCVRVCSSEELIGDDANDYCKYFKWGWDMLRSKVETTQKHNGSALVLPDEGVKIDNKSEPSAPVNKDPLDIAIKSASEKTKVTESSSLVTPDKVSDPNNEVAKPIISVEATPDIKPVSSAVDSNAENIEAGPDNKGVPSALDKVVADKNQEVEKEIERPEAAKDLPKTGNEGQVPHKDVEHENVDKKNQKQIPQGAGEYQGNDLESEEGVNEGLVDLQGGDDGEDPLISDDIKPDQVPLEDQKIESMGSSFSRDTQKEFYPSTMQDGFSEGDDHFFTFFLTAVIMVILMYILYHNKNKVSKLFFGLMVEGRQSGRRRNSRGHSYRRLDTLEQAMNTNTAAPPSKIIY